MLLKGLPVFTRTVESERRFMCVAHRTNRLPALYPLTGSRTTLAQRRSPSVTEITRAVTPLFSSRALQPLVKITRLPSMIAVFMMSTYTVGVGET